MFEKKIRIGNMFAFYGQLLTDKQQEILKYYYIHDFSLGEISEILNISRQAIHDTIKRSEKILEEYEEKLGLFEKFLKTRKEILKLIESIDLLIKNLEESKESHIIEEIYKIKELAIDILEESS